MSTEYGVLLGCGCIAGAVHEMPDCLNGLWIDALLHVKPGHRHGKEWHRGRTLRPGDKEWPVAHLTCTPFKRKRKS